MKSHIIYSLNLADVDTVVEEEKLPPLTIKELDLLCDKVGDYIPWYNCVLSAIKDIRRG